jgi:hypothetical protein
VFRKHGSKHFQQLLLVLTIALEMREKQLGCWWSANKEIKFDRVEGMTGNLMELLIGSDIDDLRRY